MLAEYLSPSFESTFGTTSSRYGDVQVTIPQSLHLMWFYFIASGTFLGLRAIFKYGKVIGRYYWDGTGEQVSSGILFPCSQQNSFALLRRENLVLPISTTQLTHTHNMA